jgi:hypothetical protein
MGQPGGTMKAKTIKQVIRAKIDEWLASIEDEALRKRVGERVIVTGGAIASMLLREPVNDFDLYLRDRETTVALADYYVRRFEPQAKNGIPCKIFVDTASNERVRIVIKSAGIASEEGTEKPYEYFESQPADAAAGYVGEVMRDAGDIQDTYEQTEQAALHTEDEDDGKPKYRPVFMSTNAITLSNRIQIVIRFYGEPDEIHRNYDFIHCTNYWTSWDNQLVLRPDALEALLAKELRYVGSKYPICSMIRTRKFIQRQWTINAGQFLKMAMQISELDLKNISVLEDQLTGVDAAYFCQVLQKLKESDPEKINSAYLVEIIDRMF